MFAIKRIVLFVIMIAVLVGCNATKDNNVEGEYESETPITSSSPSVVLESQMPKTSGTELTGIESEVPEQIEEQLKEGQIGKNIDDFNVTYTDSVINDATGKWSYILIAENIDIREYAWSAFANYAKGNEGVLAVINFTLNTTTCIKDLGGFLDVSTYEYVKGEEHDANIMYTGQLLSEDFVYDDGKVENIQ